MSQSTRSVMELKKNLDVYCYCLADKKAWHLVMTLLLGQVGYKTSHEGGPRYFRSTKALGKMKAPLC